MDQQQFNFHIGELMNDEEVAIEIANMNIEEQVIEENNVAQAMEEDNGVLEVRGNQAEIENQDEQPILDQRQALVEDQHIHLQNGHQVLQNRQPEHHHQHEHEVPQNRQPEHHHQHEHEVPQNTQPVHNYQPNRQRMPLNAIQPEENRRRGVRGGNRARREYWRRYGPYHRYKAFEDTALFLTTMVSAFTRENQRTQDQSKRRDRNRRDQN